MSSKIEKKIKGSVLQAVGIRDDLVDDALWTRLISERMSVCGIDDDKDYLDHLYTSPYEYQELIEAVVNNETWFFRDRALYRFFWNYYQTKWKRKHPKRKMKVLSLPCSSGEELYSLLITVVECGGDLSHFTFHGVDISRKALGVAKKGVYSDYSFRGISDTCREAYFHKLGKEYAINEELKSHADFFYGNLVDPTFQVNYKEYDFVVCRNMLVYFSLEAQQIAVEALKVFMDDDAVLIVSPAEGEIVRRFGFTPFYDNESIIYFKKESQPVKAEEKVKPAVSAFATKKIDIAFGEAIERLSAIKRIRSLANEGKYESAEAQCKALLKDPGMDAEVYYIWGVVLHAKGEFSAAEEAFNKALYIDPSHYESLVYLALLAEKRGNEKQKKVFEKRLRKVRR